jgi:hypothetical protein
MGFLELSFDNLQSVTKNYNNNNNNNNTIYQHVGSNKKLPRTHN